LKFHLQALETKVEQLSKALVVSDGVNTKQAPPSGKHIMLSYNWDIQNEVKLVYAALKSRNIPVWMDIEGGMSGSIHNSMAYGVENAAAVVAFMTQKYEDSANCKKELSYADDLKSRIVPIMAQNDYKQRSWLGLITAGMLWIDLRNSSSGFDAAINQLINELKSVVSVSDIKLDHVDVPTSTVPFSGNWVGFWMQQGKRGDMECDFAFGQDGSISGKGADSFGPFTWKGQTDMRSRNVSISKFYPTYTLQYEGTAYGQKSIKGRWFQPTSEGNEGTFQLSLK